MLSLWLEFLKCLYNSGKLRFVDVGVAGLFMSSQTFMPGFLALPFSYILWLLDLFKPQWWLMPLSLLRLAMLILILYVVLSENSLFPGLTSLQRIMISTGFWKFVPKSCCCNHEYYLHETLILYLFSTRTVLFARRGCVSFWDWYTSKLWMEFSTFIYCNTHLSGLRPGAKITAHNLHNVTFWLQLCVCETVEMCNGFRKQSVDITRQIQWLKWQLNPYL